MKLLRISHLGIASPTLQEAMDRLDMHEKGSYVLMTASEAWEFDVM